MDPVATGGTSGGPAIFFLSDYGTADEFVGVVHAVLHRLAPRVPVIDLSHRVPPFDIAAGSAMLVRCAPHLGPGVVLAVVDPGVGSGRGAVAVSVPTSPGPRWLIGPDNGLLPAMAGVLGGVDRVIRLGPAPPTAGGMVSSPSTFDGRDVFAPAAAHLASGGDPRHLGTEIGLDSLQPPATRMTWSGPTVAEGSDGPVLSAPVAWVDGFGNVQLELLPDELERFGVPAGARVDVSIDSGSGSTLPARRVAAFAQLVEGELGLLTDANGRVALVAGRASAAALLALPDVATGLGRGTVRVVSIRSA